jgi:hypothetical protein
LDRGRVASGWRRQLLLVLLLLLLLMVLCLWGARCACIGLHLAEY